MQTHLALFTFFVVLSAVAYGQSTQQPNDNLPMGQWNGVVMKFDSFGANGASGRIKSGQSLNEFIPRDSLRYVIDVHSPKHSNAVGSISTFESNPAECIRQLYEGDHTTQGFSGPDARATTTVELVVVATDGIWRLMVMESPLTPLKPHVWLTDQNGRTATFVLPARDIDSKADAG